MVRFPPNRLRPGLVLVFLGVLGLGGAWGGVAVVDRLESDPDFCNACHLPDGTPLHRMKLDIARKSPPLDLTARHFQHRPPGRTGAEPFSCADCHRGHGWRERGWTLLNSAYNTFRYAALPFQEPDRLELQISNRACLSCHPSVSDRVDPSRFHGIKAHQIKKMCPARPAIAPTPPLVTPGRIWRSCWRA